MTRPIASGQVADVRHRSRITNGALFARVIQNGRSGWSRRLQDLLALHIADLGGPDVISAGERSICRRIAAITVELEWIEQQSFALSKHGPTAEQLDLYFRGANNLRRLLESVGLKRVARDVTPLLQDYLRAADHPATVTTDEDDGE
ncbi:hypothetical protein SAMN05443247_06524 [Bradyrhizobium erythrophlei]|nr:hypothetical protein SAMN05443247_06524 [Bradyrhizobium erythrophlei]